ncbi:MAG: RagB/SusD family nutrient uptake outer membrane protein [Bacteroidales bacterium]|nr:RagB/SusD family nutrient uptake outer membrane protein [Bacteroidales bacterium]
MKSLNNKIILIVLAGILSLISCTDLDETVYSKMAESTFYKNENDFMEALAPVYADFRILFDWQRWWDLQETADIIMTPTRGSNWYDGGVYQRYHKHTWDPSDVHFNWFWIDAYAGIADCNKFIYQLEHTSVDIPNKGKYIAEVKCVRAFWYYLLCDAFGNIPIVDRYDVPDNYMPENQPRTKVVRFIIDEIKTNIDSLSTENNTATYGRMNRWAALFVLAKTYLNAEAWIGEAKYDSCLQVCDEILAQEGKLFSLTNDYPSMFSLNNEGNKEAIFNIPMDEKVPGCYLYMAFRKTLHPAEIPVYQSQSRFDNGACATPSFIDTWDPDDKRLAWTFVFGQRYAADGVTPLKCTGLVPGWAGKPLIYTKEVASLEAAGEPDGYRFHKYEVKKGTLITSDNDYVWFRLAYVKYMKAECLLRTGGDAQLAADLVNSVRKRAFDAAVWPSKMLTAADLLADYPVNGVPVKFGRLCMEYAWEFALEGHRREEVIRFDKNFIHGTWTFHVPTHDENKLIFPIPRDQLLVNPNLRQNPGYPN